MENAAAFESAVHHAVEEALDRLQSGLVVDAGEDAISSDVRLLDVDTASELVRTGALLVDVRSKPTLGVGLLAGAVQVQKSDVVSVFGSGLGV